MQHSDRQSKLLLLFFGLTLIIFHLQYVVSFLQGLPSYFSSGKRKKKKKHLNLYFPNLQSYVTQEDFFLGTLTVRETITYSAHLRLPTKMTKEEISNVIENTIIEMGLQDCADIKIGNWHLRGISTGEKKRLSISVEILTHPHILFLDEPTTGLDSASAFFVIRALKNISYDGRIVICSIHQPSSDVFSLFDDLLLLSGGETVYFGAAKMAIKVHT